MRYWWDHLFTASDRAWRIESGGEVTVTVGMLTDWHEEEEEKKYMREHQNDNQSFSNN